LAEHNSDEINRLTLELLKAREKIVDLSHANASMASQQAEYEKLKEENAQLEVWQQVDGCLSASTLGRGSKAAGRDFQSTAAAAERRHRKPLGKDQVPRSENRHSRKSKPRGTSIPSPQPKLNTKGDCDAVGKPKASL